MSRVYQHPDGHSIDFADNTLTMTSDTGKSVSVPIGAYGLLSLADELEAVAEARKVSPGTTLTVGDTAEQAGHALGVYCLDEILAGHTQADALIQLTEAFTALQALDHPRATGGFAVALVNVIEVGLQHLPKVTA